MISNFPVAFGWYPVNPEWLIFIVEAIGLTFEIDRRFRKRQRVAKG